MDDPIARQLGFGRAPSALARVGLGADFAALVKVPEFASAWGDVAAQVNAEGGTGLDLQSAQDTLVKAYSDLTTGQFGVDTAQALSSAKDFTLAAKTVAGSVDHVQGLLAASTLGTSPQAVAQTFQLFTGTMIGLAATAGAFSAGVGSLIVAGIGIAVSLLQGLGLFGTAPVGVQICPGVVVNPAPDWVFGCEGAWGPRVAPGAANWRAFPFPADDFWFGGHGSGGTWKGATYSGSMQVGGGRVIDTAFPDYYYLEIESNHPIAALADFQRAFFAAWRANKEYALNGLAVQPDWQVLVHLVRIWNRAHEPGDGFALTSIPRPALSAPAGASGPQDLALPIAMPPYEMTLVTDVLNNVSANDPTNYVQNGQLLVHTGAIKAPKRVTTLHFGAAPAVSAGRKLAVGAGVAAGAVLGGSALLAWAKGETFSELWSGAWRGAKKAVHLG